LKKIRLIALDMDGTVLTDDKRITRRTAEVIKTAVEKGILVVPASGRTVSTLPREILSIPGIRYVISCNGACVTDRVSGKHISENLIPYETVLQILNGLEKYDCVAEACMEDVLYLSERDREREIAYSVPELRQFMGALRTETPDVKALVEEKKAGAEKLLILMRDEEEWDKIRIALLKRKELEVSFSIRNNLEVNVAGVSKGSSLKALADYLQIGREEIMVCGDSGNDLSLFSYAGFSVAMGNAEPEIRRKADAVTLKNTEDGVASAIEKYIFSQ